MSKKTPQPEPKPQVAARQAVDLAVGDCIVVKPGINDPDLDMDIGGWQGRVTEIKSYQSGKVTVTFQWDSLALQRMPASVISRCEEEGLDWTSIGLYPEEVERAAPRDTQADVDALIEKLTAEHAWDYLGVEGQSIHQVLRDVDEDDEMAAFAAWQKHLKARVKLPFEAEVTEWQERSPLQSGDRVTVVGFEDVDDSYGVLVKIKTAGHRTYAFPLCDLTALDENSASYTLTYEYAVWFANR